MNGPGRQAEVVIIGAGPAGSAAAITCATSGLSVLILERAAFPRDRPGESLHPGVEALFTQLGSRRCAPGRPVRPLPGLLGGVGTGPGQFVPFGEDANGPWRGFQAWRAELDALLLERVRALGVEVLQPCRALQPLRGERGEVVGVETGGRPVHARVVIDAAGGAHWLARALDIPRLKASPNLVATYGYVVDADGSPEGEAPRIVADDEGWTWTAPVRPGVQQWTRLNLDGRPAPEGWLPPELRGCEPLGRRRGADVTWRRVASPAGPGYLMVGDAAAVLDPASSHGVLKALMSGMMAGHAVVGGASGTLPWPMALSSYAEWVRRWFEHDVAQLRERYRRFPHWGTPGPG